MVSSLELSEELYKLSGWDGTHIFYDAENDPVESRRALLMHPTKNCPAYDTGYLLRWLPNKLPYSDGEIALHLNIWWSGGWQAHYGKYDWYAAIADTPENALALLAIKLFKSGVLESEHYATGYNKALDDVRKALEEYIK